MYGPHRAHRAHPTSTTIPPHSQRECIAVQLLTRLLRIFATNYSNLLCGRVCSTSSSRHDVDAGALAIQCCAFPALSQFCNSTKVRPHASHASREQARTYFITKASVYMFRILCYPCQMESLSAMQCAYEYAQTPSTRAMCSRKIFFPPFVLCARTRVLY